MQFTSRFAALQLPVRDEERRYFPDGRSIVLRPALLADFAEEAFSETYSGYEDADGSRVQSYEALAGGGFFDSDRAAERHGWTDEEKSAVEAHLLRNADNEGDCQLHVIAPPTAPWPTYDKMREELIVKNAREMGLAQEAVIYEERTLGREEILGPLREDLAQEAAESELSAA